MPSDVHPLLRPKEEVAEPVAEAAVLEETPTEAPVPEPTPEVPVAEEPKPRRVIDLDAEDLYSQVQRYATEDPKFQNIFNSAVGRKVAKDYAPKLTQLEAEKARLEQRLREIEMQNLSEEDLNAKLRDPEFRKRYDQKPEDPALIEVRGQFNAALARAEDSVANYLDPNELGAFRKSLMSGYFNAERDAQGNPLRQLTAQETLVSYNNALHEYARTKAATKQAPKAEVPTPAPQPAAAVVAEEAPAPPSPKPVANTRLAQLSPDLSTPAPSGGSPQSFKLSEVRRMAPPERLRHFPTGAALQEAIDKGTVLVDV